MRGESDLSQVVYGIDVALHRAKATSLVSDPEQIAFRGGFFRWVGSGNQLVAIGSGKLMFSERDNSIDIIYRLSFMHLFIVVTGIIAIVFVLPNALWGDLRSLAGFPLGAWLWLFGGNYVLTIFRFPRFIRTAAENSLLLKSKTFAEQSAAGNRP